MIFKYGNSTHAQNEVALTIQKRVLYSTMGFRQAIRETWTLNGVLHAPNQVVLTAAISTLQNAYAVPGQDAGLFLDDGITPTSHVMLSSQTIGGVRVVGLDFPRGEGAEYSTFRTYTIVLEADFPDSSAPNLVSYNETVEFKGGGPKFVFMQTLKGKPKKQLVVQHTPYEATQKGSAVGYTWYPPSATTLWPEAEVFERRLTSLVTPKFHGGGAPTEYQINWSYFYKSDTPFVGLPRIPDMR